MSVSKGLLEAADYPQVNLEIPPCFYYAGENIKLLGALLHRNLLHLIPISLQNGEYKLTDPVTVSVGDSDIEDLTSLNASSTRSKVIFASIEHNALAVTSDYELSVYEIEDKDTIAKSNQISPFNRDLTEKFRSVGKYQSSKAMNKVVSMPFGGLLVFTSSKIIYFEHGDYNRPFATQGLFKDVSKVQCVEFIDSMTDIAQYTNDIFRIVVYTENGQLYLVVFDLKSLKSGESFKFMNVSYQGIMHDAVCMAYLNDGHFICGTRSGYFISKLVDKHTGDHSSPYIVNLARNEECAAISNIELVDKNEYDPKELVVSTQVKDNHSVINIYRRGITLDKLISHEISRISYMNMVEINTHSYLVMNIARHLKIMKVINNPENLEEDREEQDRNSDAPNETNDFLYKNVDLEFAEIFDDENELIYASVLETKDHFKVNLAH